MWIQSDADRKRKQQWRLYRKSHIRRNVLSWASQLVLPTGAIVGKHSWQKRPGRDKANVGSSFMSQPVEWKINRNSYTVYSLWAPRAQGFWWTAFTAANMLSVFLTDDTFQWPRGLFKALWHMRSFLPYLLRTTHSNCLGVVWRP